MNVNLPGRVGRSAPSGHIFYDLNFKVSCGRPCQPCPNSTPNPISNSTPNPISNSTPNPISNSTTKSNPNSISNSIPNSTPNPNSISNLNYSTLL